MLTSSYASFQDFAGTWETWCDQKYAGQPDLLAKCKNNALPAGLFAPWTVAGQTGRGLPGGLSLPGTSPAPPPTATDTSLNTEAPATDVATGLSMNVLLVGAGVLALGLAGIVVLAKKKKSAAPAVAGLAGYRRRKRRR